MRRALIGIAAAAALVPGSAEAATKPSAPTPAQMRAAVAKAERSPYLWATVNVCAQKKKGGGVMGVRGEMPALGFTATMAMSIRLNQYSTTRKRYIPLPGATATRPVSLGAYSLRVHQGGAEFPFSGATGKLDAVVTFTWRRAGKLLGKVTRTTTAGHPQAAYSRPAHYSAASCTLR